MRKISRSLATSVMSAIALAGALREPQLRAFAVIQDHAGVPRHVLAGAIQTVTDVDRPLGIGIAWIRAPYPAPEHSDAIPESGVTDGSRGEPGRAGCAGREMRPRISATSCTGASAIQETGHALGYVIAHLLKGVLSHDAMDRPTLVRADRQTARRLAEVARLELDAPCPHFARILGRSGARLDVPVFPHVSRLQWRGGRRRDEDDAKRGDWDGNRSGNHRHSSRRGSGRGAWDGQRASLHTGSYE